MIHTLDFEKLKWGNLKKNKCPQCEKDFTKGLKVVLGTLMTHTCGFGISEQRYKEIVSGMVEKQLSQRDENNENS